jgi:hypothetical protein
MNLTSYWNLTKELFDLMVKSVQKTHSRFLCLCSRGVVTKHQLQNLAWVSTTCGVSPQWKYKGIKFFVLDSVGATYGHRITLV